MIPVNMTSHVFGTVAYWRSAAKHYGARGWKGAMRGFALQHGKAVAMRGDDSALFCERDDSRADGVVFHAIPADGVRWHRGF